ncbi:DUF6443 domain-containing protein [Aquimarina sp. 2201CG14-23]|uniref:DUF6443 domain-containing protein n=1 Tax=Aquimarina mycalae TaxID=3040073 RepID=UPI002477DDD0|nr:DUF6443 domain-containing protein [Aquimarina sp. 2201CG14-23]
MKRYLIYIYLFLPILGWSQFTPISGDDCSDVAPNATKWYIDNDGDGYHGLQYRCEVNRPNGYIAQGTFDCNDNDSSVGGFRTWYRDADGDGYGTSSTTAKNCYQPSGYVANANDCNDSNPSINITKTWYRDADGDGYGVSSNTKSSCSQPSGYISRAGDCNDNNVTVNPGAVEPCNKDNIDNNCNGQVDERSASTPTFSITKNCGNTIIEKGIHNLSIETWFWQSSATGTSTSNSSQAITKTSNGTIYLRGRNNSSNCWGTAKQITYNVNTLPSVPTATVSNQCGKSILTRNNPPSGITWYWQSSSGGTSTANSSTSITRTSGSTYYLRARNNSTGCWSAVRTVNYSIKSVPTAPSAPTVSNYCGNSVLTRSNPPSGITWYWQSSSTGTSTTNSSTSITRTSGSTYYLRARNNSTGCWSSVRTVNYSIKSVPATPSAPTVSNNCGNSVLTRSNPPSEITWYWQSSSVGTSTTNSSTSITRTSGSTYYLRARNNFTGCWSTARTVSYNIKSVPATPSAPTVSNNCGNSVLTKSNSPSGITWYWQSSSTGTSTANSNTSITRTSGSTYYLRARNNSSLCWSTARTVSYSIKSIPATPAAPTVVNNCGNSVLTRSNPISGITWYWQSSSGGTSTANSSTSITRTSGSTYYLRARNNTTGCWSTARTVNYSIKSVPPTPNAPTVVNNCGNSVLTRSNPPSGITWYWQSGSTGTSTSNSNASITRTSGSTYYVRARNNSTGCWSTARTVSYSIKSVPATPTAPIVSNNCGNSVLTKSNPPSGVTWYWQNTSGGTSTASSNASITRTSGSTYYLRARNNTSGCWSSTRVINYSIQPTPTWYKDMDNDGFATTTVTQCNNPGTGYTQTVLSLTDCNDNDASVHPDKKWYADTDGDGFGDPNSIITQCIQPSGYVANAGDNCPSITGTANGCSEGLYNDITLSNENYVFTRVYQKGMISPNSIQYNKDVIESISYFDGLGRPKQQVSIKASPTLPDNNYTNELSIDWSPGNGSTGFFNQNGSASENNRETGVDPNGKLSLLWKCGNDINRDADGGWNTDYINVDKNVGYRYTVWVKRTGSQNGTTYHGTQNVNNLNNTENSNPYFFYGDLPQLDTWYLMVGVIHPYQYSGENSNISGIYDINGNKVLNGNEFKWRNNTTTSRFRNYLYYSTDPGTNQFFWNPVLQKIDGDETSISDMVNNLEDSPKDIITHITYDQYGRQAKNHLPFVSNGLPGSYNAVDIHTDINSYYQNKYADDFSGITNVAEINAHSESIFEASPINRVLEQGAPGKDWKADHNNDSDHTIKFNWSTNTLNDNIPYFKVAFINENTEAPQLIQQEYYNADELHITFTKDENWQPGQTHANDHTTQEYKNKLGQVILKRTFNNNEEHNTYYVYDDFGNLTYVLPPKVDTSDGISEGELTELCYQYKYDSRNRLVEKKIPGKGWEYIVYNKLDQPVMTQDANQRAKSTKEWLFTKYDAFGRVAYTGMRQHNGSRIELQQAVNSDNFTQFIERSATPITIAGTQIYYTNTSVPVGITKIYTINYYDDYNFDLFGMDKPTSVYGVITSNDVKGLPTGSKVRVLDTNNWITTVTAYNDKAQAIWTGSRNHYLSTIDRTQTKLDFAGKPLEVLTSHVKNGSTSLITKDTFTYDHMGRLLTQKQQINNQEEELIAHNVYDELGQLERKKVGNTAQAPLQTIDYKYNVRGWLTDINDVGNIGNDLFAFGINYNTTSENLGATVLYNGNISETLWKTANDNTKRAYGYQYDALNRITKGLDNTTNNDYGLMNVVYDKNGNITTLARRGQANLQATSFGYMDVLTYEYDTGNKLAKVSDNGGSYGFKDGTNTNNDFEYDINGNMIIDRNKGISSITYNHLNLPNTVAIANNTGTGNISYIYDATGVKLKKIATEGSSVTTTEYAGNYIYKNGTLEFMNHPEGYIEPNTSGGFDYIYQYKDHLGNIRLSYLDTNNDGSVNATEIREEKNYYPFGLQHKGYNDTVLSEHPYGYNGKEEQAELGLNWIDYGARNYDASLGRWMNLDPLAEVYHTDTPYVYVLNNPLSFIDPDGREVVGVTKNDASKFHFSLNRIFKGDQFNSLRSLFTRGKRNNKKTFDKIDEGALKEALSELEGDDLALAQVVAGAINSDDEHKVEFIELDGDISREGSSAVVKHLSTTGINLKLNENQKLEHSTILELGKGGFNVPTNKGSHSFISENAYHPNGKDVTGIHELIGHGISSAKGLSSKINNANAIRTENLVLRVLGKPEDQRDGSGKDGKAFHGGGKVENSRALPLLKN